MKKLSIILFLLIVGFFAKAQTTPYTGLTGYAVNQSIGSDSAAVNSKGALTGRLVVYRFADTTTANLQRIKNYPFAVIATTSDNSLWTRNKYASQWMRGSGSIDITNIDFLTDSSLVICFSNGSCDTIAMTNFTDIVVSIINNFMDSTSTNNITFINDSTIIICDGLGSCDTVSLGNTNNFYFLNDSTLITCDTPIVVQQGDEFVTQQLCDTIFIPKQYLYKFQNGLQEISPGIVEFGAPLPADNFSALKKKTYLNQDFYSLNFGGRSTLEELINITQSQPVTSGILQLKRDVGNDVGLYFHRFDPFAPLGDSVGLMSWVNKGYAIVTNAGSNWYSVRVDDENAKQTGIFFHDRDTGNIDAVTIFGQQVPAGYGFANNPPPDTSFYNQRIAVFKTNHDVQFPNYPNTRNNGTTGIAFYPDADGNVRVGPTVGGSEITIINDTTITICSFGDMLCDTFITTVVNPIQLVTIINDSTLQVCDTLGNCDTLNIGSGGGASIDEKFFTPNQTSLGNTRHETNTWNFSVGNSLFISNSASNGFNFGKNSRINGGDLNTVFLNNNTVSGNENFVAGRNMVVSGNTNFAAATDGTVSNANYSATFGDANDQRGTASILTGFGNDNFTENGFTGGSDNVNGGTSPGTGTPNLYSNTFVYGLQNRVTGNRSFVGGQSITAAGNNITAFGTTMSLSTASSFNVGYDANVDFQITDDKVRINAAMFQEYKGADILSATDLVLGTDGNTFAVAGTTTIQDISTTNWQAGSVIRLLFNTVLTVKHNTGPNLGYAVILLAGSVDLTTDANTVLTLLYNGTEWEECSRKLAGSSIGGSITADNGLTANTATNVRLGGTLLQNTTIATTGSFKLTVSGSNTAKTLEAINTSSGSGLYASSVSGNAILGESGTTAAMFRTTTALTNTTQSVMEIIHNSSGTALAGFGSELNFDLSSATVADRIASQIKTKWVVATDATRTAQQDYYSVNSGTLNNVMSIYGGGVVGIGISSGYAATRLEVVDNASTASPTATFTSASTGQTIAASNSSTGYAVAAVGTDGYGVYAVSGSQFGVWGQSTSNAGVYGQSTSSYAGYFYIEPTSTNSVATLMQLDRRISGGGTAANGIGFSIDMRNQTDDASTVLSNQIISRLTNADGPANYVSQLEFTGKLASSTVSLMKMNGDGSWQIRPITATAASAITPAEGMLVFVSSTDATFVTIGIWCYQNGAWKAL